MIRAGGRSRRLDTVLLVDDDAQVRASLAEVLDATLRDVVILEAADGAEALKVCEKGTVDLVISDERMPNLDGLGLASLLELLDPPPVVFILTGHADLPLALEAINKAKVAKLFTKPADPEELAIAAWEALDARWTAWQKQEAARPHEAVQHDDDHGEDHGSDPPDLWRS